MLRTRLPFSRNESTRRFSRILTTLVGALLAVAVAGVRLPAAGNPPVQIDDKAANADAAAKAAGDEQRADEAGYDALPPGVVRVFGKRLMRTWAQVSTLALSPDGNTLAINGGFRFLIVDWRTGRTIKTVEHGTWGAKGMAFNPEGRLLAVGTSSGTIELWDIEKNSLLRSMEADPQATGAVLFFQNGQKILSGGLNGEIKVWDADTGEMLRAWRAHDPAETWGYSNGVRLALSRDETLLVSGHADGVVKVWDPSIGALRDIFEGHMKPPSRCVSTVAITPDGKYVASGGRDGHAVIWERATGNRVFEQSPQDSAGAHPYENVRNIAFSPNGKSFAIARSRNWKTMVALWDVETMFLRGELYIHHGRMWIGQQLAFSPDGRFLLSSADDRTVRVWNLEEMADHHPPPLNTSWLCEVAFSPDSGTLATVSFEGEVVNLWNVETGEHVRSLPLPSGGDEQWGAIWDVAFSADGRFIAAASRSAGMSAQPGTPSATVWEVNSGNKVVSNRGERVCLAADRPWAGIGRSDGAVVLDVESEEEVFSCDHPGEAGVFLVHGTTLFVSGKKGTKAWNLGTGEVTFSHGNASTWVDVSRNGRVFVASSGSNIALYETHTGERIGKLSAGDIAAVRVSHDGRMVASADRSGNVLLWDVKTRDLLQSWRIGHTVTPVWDLAFSPNGRYLATANLNGTAYLLEVPRQ